MGEKLIMRTLLILMLAVTSINLTACSSMRGNVIPQKGPTMEQIYDSMGSPTNLSDSSYSSNSADNAEDLKKIHQQTQRSMAMQATPWLEHVSANAVNREFRELPNPPLRVYVYPHLAGEDQVPVPGYYTVFTVYDHDYYVLADEE